MRTFRINLIVIITFSLLGLVGVPWGSIALSQQETKSLKYRKMDKETILITEGISYRKDIILKEKCTIFIEDVSLITGVLVFIASKGSVIPFTSDKLLGGFTVKLEESTMFLYSFTKGSNREDLIDAVNVTWIFRKPDMAIEINGLIFTSKKEASLLNFTKEGILLKGFEIKSK